MEALINGFWGGFGGVFGVIAALIIIVILFGAVAPAVVKKKGK